MADINILNTATLSDKRYPLKQVTFERPDLKGEIIQKKNEIYFRPDAVAVLMIDASRETILFTKQFRIATYLNGNPTGYVMEACAGLIDEGETPEQTAVREVDEETGYAIQNLIKVGQVYTSVGALPEIVHLFTATYSSANQHGEGGGKEGEGEDIELVELTFDDAYKKLKHGEFIDSKTVLLLQHYFLNNPR
jgi:GDP-mannose pyrophosphatase NudK